MGKFIRMLFATFMRWWRKKGLGFDPDLAERPPLRLVIPAADEGDAPGTQTDPPSRFKVINGGGDGGAVGGWARSNLRIEK